MASKIQSIGLFLGGDVMTGRGLDQIMTDPAPPELHESHATSARDYVRLAEAAHGPIPAPVGPAYVWGDALAALERAAPDLRIINLETAVTRRGRPAPKGIHYRMSPENAGCLGAAGIDACVLANNHVLDWGLCGLEDTLDTLAALGIAAAGAGRTAEAAAAPAVLPVPGRGRVLLYGRGHGSSGIPPDWQAGPARPGVALLDDLSPRGATALADRIAAERRPDDVVGVSIHWGPNWGYAVTREQQAFARALIDSNRVDLVHGHSSHHFLGGERRRGRLILYGCGDLLTDYEGIGGYEEFRGDLALLYLARVTPGAGRPVDLEMQPCRLGRFRLQPTRPEDLDWLARRLDREYRRFGAEVAPTGTGGFRLAAP